MVRIAFYTLPYVLYALVKIDQKLEAASKAAGRHLRP